MLPDRELLQSLPKVALHDHLDGGVRPQTVIDHCEEIGHSLPSHDPDTLGTWFYNAANSGSLVSYLSTFSYTVAAMQKRGHLHRVAKEFVLDQAAQGVVYAEARWAPEQHTLLGLTESQAVEAVRDGIADGVAEVESAGRTIMVNQILTSMRHLAPTTRIAELVVAYRDQGVCAFDIAGAEEGFLPSRFGEAFEYLRRNNAYYTIHSGEAAGPDYIWDAVQLCGAQRIGHGVRIADDITVGPDGEATLGRLAAFIRNRRITLEVCPSSNLQTGVATSLADHPISLLKELDFRVAVSCDNRLMSRTNMTDEFAQLMEQLDWTLADVEWCTINAVKGAFLDHDQRRELINKVIRPAYAKVIGVPAR